MYIESYVEIDTISDFYKVGGDNMLSIFIGKELFEFKINPVNCTYVNVAFEEITQAG